VLAAYRPLLALFLGVSCCVAASGLAGTLIALRLAGTPTVGATVAGLVLSAFSAGMVVGAGVAERTIARVGHIRAFAAFAGTTCAALLLVGVTGSPWVWLGARFLYGLCMAGLYIAAESWISDRAQLQGGGAGTLFAVYTTITQLALAGGQVLVVRMPEAAAPDGFVAAGMLLALGLVPVALTNQAEPVLEEVERLPIRSALRRVPLAVVGALAAGGCVGALMGIGPLFARALGWAEAEVGGFMGTLVAAGLLLQWPVGRLSNLVDRRIVLLSASGILVAAAVLLAWLVGTDAGFLPLMAGVAVVGSVTFLLYPLSLAHAGDYLERSETVPANATLVAVYGIGAALGPWVGAELTRVLGPLSLPAVLGAFGLGPALYAVYRLARRQAARQGERVTYFPVALPQVSYRSELDPRGDPLQLPLTYEDGDGRVKRLRSMPPVGPAPDEGPGGPGGNGAAGGGGPTNPSTGSKPTASPSVPRPAFSRGRPGASGPG